MSQDLIYVNGFGADLADIAANSDLNLVENRDYAKAMDTLLDLSEEFISRVEDFNDQLYAQNLPLLEWAILDNNKYYVYFPTIQLYNHHHMYTKHELRSFIKRFVADALWSEYSAQFDDANYPIDEDKFIKTAKTFVKPQLIHDIEDYDFA